MPELDTRTQFGLKISEAPEAPEQDQPITFDQYLRIDMEEENRKTLAIEVLSQIDDILMRRKERQRRVIMFRNQYRQLLQESSWPFPGAFNVHVPVTTDKVDTALAETEEIFTQVDPRWTVQGPKTEEAKDAVIMQQRVLDSYEDLIRQAGIPSAVWFDAWLLGTGWEARIFKRETIPQFEERTWTNLDEFIADFPSDWEQQTKIVSDLKNGREVRRLVEWEQETLRAPVSEHVEWEDAIVPIETNGLDGMRTVPLAGRRVWMRWSQVAELERKGDYLPGVSEELKHHAKSGDGNKIERGEYNPDYKRDPIETFEVAYLMLHPQERDLEGNVTKWRLIRTLINIERKHKIVMRVIRYPYGHGRPYLIPHYIQKTEHGLYQPGLGDKLQQINISLNALVSHVLNAGLIGTSLSFKVRTQTDAVRAMHEKQWFPGSITEMSNPEDAQQWRIDMPNLGPLVDLFAVLMGFADQVTGITQLVSGQSDPQNPDAPDIKTARLMRRALKKLRRYVNTLKESVNESGLQALRLIQQHIPPAQIAVILGAEEADVRRLLRMKLPTLTHAAVFDVDRFAKLAEDQRWVGLLMREPLVAGVHSRRLKLYRILAESEAGDWRDKLDDILPTDQELEELEKQGQEGDPAEIKNRVNEIVQRATQKARASGASEQEAAAIGQQTAQRVMQLMQARGAGTNGNQPTEPAGAVT